MRFESGKRLVVEEVSGKNVNLCHIIANPDRQVLDCLATDDGAMGIISLSPGETAIPAAEYIARSASLDVIFIDRYLGTILVQGTQGNLYTACANLLRWLSVNLAFPAAGITCS